MSKRNCIYTNKEAKAKDNVLSKASFPDLIHNWCNSAPVSDSYKTKKQGNTSELELLANEYFHLIELHEMRIEFYKNKLSEIQEILNKQLEDSLAKKEEEKEEKKEQEMKAMVVLKEINEGFEEGFSEVLDSRLESFKDVIGDITLKKENKPSVEEDDDDIWSK